MQKGSMDIIVGLVVVAMLIGGFSTVLWGNGEIHQSTHRAYVDQYNPPSARVIPDLSWADTTNEEGNNFVEVTNGTEPAFEARVGDIGITFGVEIQSLKDDDGNDTNGDDVLYDINVSVVNDPSLIYYEDPETGDLIPISDLGIGSPIESLWVPNVKKDETSANNYNALYGGTTTKTVPNWNNEWLDENNDWSISNNEVWNINNGPQLYKGLKVNISTDVPAGYYVIPIKVQYRYYDYIPIAPSGILVHQMLYYSGSVIYCNHPDYNLGVVQWYWWVPYNKSSGGYPTFGEFDENTPITTHNMENIGFKKIYPYTNGVFDVSQVYGYHKAYNNTGQLNASWFGIRDDHVDEIDTREWVTYGSIQEHPWISTTSWANLNASWDDGNNSVDSGSTVDWIDGAGGLHTGTDGGNPPGGYPTVESIWDGFRDTTGFSTITIDRTPTLEGNGTWAYSGHLTDAQWHYNSTLNTTVFSEIEYIFIKIIGTSATPGGNPQVQYTLTPADTLAGDDFEPWTMTFVNNDDVDISNLQAHLELPQDIPQGGFSFYGGYDTASVPQVPKNGGTAQLTWRITTDASTPPGIYQAQVTFEYDKTFVVDMHYHAQVTITRHIVETAIVNMIVDYTPALHAELPSVRAYVATQQVIDTSVGEHTFTLRVENMGNTKIYSGPNGTSNINMNFAAFQLSGPEIYDSDLNQFFDIKPVSVGDLDVGNYTDVTVDVKINNHWNLQPGTYRLMADFFGFYYDNGSTGNPSGFVAFTIKWEGTPLQPVMYRDLNAPYYPDPNWMNGEAAEPAQGIYVDITILDFMKDSFNGQPLREMPKLTFSGGTASVSQGQASVDVTLTIQNTGNADIRDLKAELLLSELDAAAGGSYMMGESFYEGDNNVGVNPVATVDTLNAGDSATLTFHISGLNPYIPPGIHKIPVKITAAYWDGRWNDPAIEDYIPDDPINDEYSRYNILWDTGTIPFEAYFDENENGIVDAADTQMDDPPYIVISSTDDMPDLAITLAYADNLYIGEPYSNAGSLIDRTIRVNVKNLELYPLLNPVFTIQCGDGTPILNPADHNATTIQGEMTTNKINPGSTVTVTFTVDVNNAMPPGAYVVNVTLVSATNGNTLDRFTTPMSYPITLRLLPTPGYITVSDYTFDPNPKPGSEFTLHLTLMNNGNTSARNVIVTLGSEFYQDSPFSVIDAFIASISSADYNVDLNGDGQPDGPYVVAKKTNVSLSDLAIDNLTDILYAERMLKAPTAKIPVLYIEEIKPHQTITVDFLLRADINMMVGREYTEKVLIEHEDIQGIQRVNGPYEIKIVTDSYGSKVTPERPPSVATKSDVMSVKESLASSNNILMAIVVVLIILILVVVYMAVKLFMPPKGREPMTVQKEEFTPPPEPQESFTPEPVEEFPSPPEEGLIPPPESEETIETPPEEGTTESEETEEEITPPPPPEEEEMENWDEEISGESGSEESDVDEDLDINIDEEAISDEEDWDLPEEEDEKKEE